MPQATYSLIVCKYGKECLSPEWRWTVCSFSISFSCYCWHTIIYRSIKYGSISYCGGVWRQVPDVAFRAIQPPEQVSESKRTNSLYLSCSTRSICLLPAWLRSTSIGRSHQLRTKWIVSRSVEKQMIGSCWYPTMAVRPLYLSPRPWLLLHLVCQVSLLELRTKVKSTIQVQCVQASPVDWLWCNSQDLKILLL